MPGALEIGGAATDDDGNIYFASEEGNNIQVTRLSANGEHEWTYVYPHLNEEGLYGDGLRVGPNGIVVVGYTIGTGTNSRDGLILHLDFDGTLLDAQRIDVASSNALHWLNTTSDGGFIASGRADGLSTTSNDMYDMLLAKLDADGVMQWSRTYGSAAWDWGYQPLQMNDGGYTLVGYGDALGTGYSPSGFVVRTDALGNEMWTRSISCGAGVDELYCVAEASDGSIYVGGRSLGFIVGDVSAFITKLTSTGEHVWTRAWEHGVEVVQLIPSNNGGISWLAHPQFYPGGGGGNGYDIAYGTFSADGTMQQAKYYGTDSTDNGMAFFRRADGGFSIFGFTNVKAWGRYDAQLIVTDAAGDVECDALEPDINWINVTAVVSPFTPITHSGFTAFPYPHIRMTVGVDTYNPCCNELAAFSATQGSDGFTWTFTDASTGANSYAWDFGDGTTSTLANPVHTYASNNSWTACLTITGNCGTATSCQTLNVNVGIAEADNAAGAPTVFPQPAAGHFTVRSNNAPIMDVQVTDDNGRTVLRAEDGGKYQIGFPTASLAPGLYVAHVTLANHAQYHLKVMVAP